MLELDVKDVLSLCDTSIFQPICIRKVRLRQCKQYYEVEWKQHQLPSTPNLEDQLQGLSLGALDGDDDDEEKLITLEPADLFRCAYPEIVYQFEVPPVSKGKKTKKTTTTSVIHDEKPVMRKKKCKATSTSMSLDLLSMIEERSAIVPENKANVKEKFHHRPTMAALSTSISLDVLSVLQKSHGNLNALKKSSRSRPIKHQPRSDLTVQSKSTVHSRVFQVSTNLFSSQHKNRSLFWIRRYRSMSWILSFENNNNNVWSQIFWSRKKSIARSKMIISTHLYHRMKVMMIVKMFCLFPSGIASDDERLSKRSHRFSVSMVRSNGSSSFLPCVRFVFSFIE